MRSDIAQAVSGCDQCQTVCQAKPVKTPYLDRSASHPLEAVSVDLCKSKGLHFLVAVDRFSGYPWVARLTSKTTGAVIAIMEKWFCKFGWPQRLGSDGGPQFHHEFEEWCAANTSPSSCPLLYWTALVWTVKGTTSTNRRYKEIKERRRDVMI
jgi:hypothetical protein